MRLCCLIASAILSLFFSFLENLSRKPQLCPIDAKVLVGLWKPRLENLTSRPATAKPEESEVDFCGFIGTVSTLLSPVLVPIEDFSA
jgi:hypothetical protein